MHGVSGTAYVLSFWSVVCILMSALSIGVAIRERRGLGGLGLAAAWNGRRAPRGQLRYEVSVGCMRRQHKKKALTAAELKGIAKVHQLVHQPARNSGEQCGTYSAIF